MSPMRKQKICTEKTEMWRKRKPNTLDDKQHVERGKTESKVLSSEINYESVANASQFHYN